ncbi:hypothetical protein Daesc_007964 [Daldinia eschscholtzii]|uniref:Uncharacterized protein n=1 Tax=Daldinia eschscholtzii TaxID=292717 RepID=A0AAX6MFM4_9PEZI
MDRITDEEKNVPQIVGIDIDTSSEETHIRPNKTGFLAKLRSYEDALDRKLGVESHSIEPGAVAASALHNNQQWNEQYEIGVGFLLQTMIHPHGLAKAILFLLMFASVGLNCGSMYSAGLSIQQASRSLAAVPRFVWEIICFAAVIALGLAGSDRLLVFLQNFLSLLGYYATAVFVCLFTEHYLFRRGSFENYNLDNWNNRSMLPAGCAGGLAFAFGIVGGNVLSLLNSMATY